MWELAHPWWEYIFRAVLLYSVVFLLFRIGGKKQIGEMSPFDLVLLLIVSESISEAITGGDDSLTAGIIAVTSFITLNYVLDILMFNSPKLEKILDGEAQLLIFDGKVNEKVRSREKITQEEILSSLREHGLDRLGDVAYAILETNGKISIIKKLEEKSPPDNPRQEARI